MPVGPTIPTPHPSNAVIGLNNEPVDPSAMFGEIFGSAAPTLMADAAQPVPSLSPDMAASEVLPELAPNQSQSSEPPDRLSENLMRLQAITRAKEQKAMLDEMALPESERAQADRNVTESELEALAFGYDDTVLEAADGGVPPQREQFNDEGESVGSQIERFRQNPMQYWKDYFREQMAAMRSGLGQNEGQRVRGFKGVWNDPETGASTAWKDGKLYVKYPNSNGYVPVGEKKLDVLNNMFLKMLQESGMITEMAVGTGAELATAGAGALASAAGHPIAGGALAFSAPAVGGAAGVLARSGLRRGFDAVYGNSQLSPEESERLGWETMKAAGINLATAGLMKAVPAGYRHGKDILSRSFPEQTLAKMDAVNQMWKGYIDKYSRGFASGSMREGAQEVKGVVHNATEKLIKDVGTVESVVRARAGKDTKFGLTNTLDSMKSVLEDFRATIDPETGKVTFPENVAEAELGLMQEMGEEGARVAEAELLARAESGKTAAAFGQLGGKEDLIKMAKLYEELFAIDKTGGADIKTLLGYLDGFNFEGDLAKKIARPNELTETYRKFRNAAAQDRALAYEKVLKGSGLPEEDLFQDIYAKYHQNIDDHVRVLKIFDDQKSVENFIKRTGKQSETVETIAKVLGTDSPAWSRYKGEFLYDIVRESTDASTGMFNGKRFIDILYKEVPEGARNQLFTKEELKQFATLARASQKLPYASFLNGEDKLAIGTLSGIGKDAFIGTRVKLALALTGRNAEAMDYLISDAIFDQIRKAGTQSERNQLLAARRYMDDLVKQMQNVTVKRNGKLVKVLVPAVRNVIRKTPEMKERILDKSMENAKETGVFLYPPDEEPQI